MPTPRLPGVFLSHGSPMLVLDPGAIGAIWRGIGEAIGRPQAVLVISAHWETRDWTVSVAETPETIHDFSGFPDALYAVDYPAPGAPDVARRAARALMGAGLSCREHATRGLDHGAWVPLRQMYPDGDVPVAQLSICPDAGPRAHFAAGRALEPLRAEGVLLLASGGAVHNLGEWTPGATRVPDWAQRFDDRLAALIETGDPETLIADWVSTTDGRRAHPRDEHLLPVMVAFGAGGAATRGRALHRGFADGALSLSAFAFD